MDKLTLAVSLAYIDDVIESRLSKTEKKVNYLQEKLLVSLLEDKKQEAPATKEIVYYEEDGVMNRLLPGEQGPKGDKGDPGLPGKTGKQGPKGPEGKQGPKGDKGDPGPIGLRGFAGEPGLKGDKGDKGDQGPQGERGDVGPQGPKGPKGDRGEQGPRGKSGLKGKDGPQGERGVGLDRISFDEETNIFTAHKTDGTSHVVGDISSLLRERNEKVSLAEETAAFKGKVNTEVDKIRGELESLRLDVSSKISTAIMSSSPGSGEVRIEYMDDFDRSALPVGGGILTWDDVSGTFTVSQPTLSEIAARIRNIETYLNETIPPFPKTTGVVTFDTPSLPYLIEEGNSIEIPRGDSNTDLKFISGIKVLSTVNENVSAQTTITNESIFITSNDSLLNTQIKVNFVAKVEENGPFPLTVEGNLYTNTEGTRIIIPFEQIGIDSIESVLVTDSFGRVVSITYFLHDDKIIFNTTSSRYGLKIHMLVNRNGSLGSNVMEVDLSDMLYEVDFASNGINTVRNALVFDKITNESIEVLVDTTENSIIFSSSIDMTGSYAKIWFI